MNDKMERRLFSLRGCKLIVVKALSLLLVVLSFACDKDSGDVVKKGNVAFLENSLPSSELSAQGGILRLQVEWEYTEWQITIGDVIEGEEFITSITPDEGGEMSEGKTNSPITVRYKSNPGMSVNKQEILLSSLDGSIKKAVVLAQASTKGPLVELFLDPATTYQTMAGFGGCNSVFRGSANYPNATDMQKAFGTGADELGLSILRISIPAESSKWGPVATVAQEAYNLGAKVFATPWDAPADLRDPDNTEERMLLPSKYGEYVEHLNSFDTYMSTNGVNLHAISVQNEPDIGEWTQWTPDEVFNFMKDHADNINHSKVITPESFNFNRVYYNDILANAYTRNNFEIVGGHIYGNGLGTIPAAEQYGKEIWMTEYLMNEYTGVFEDSDIPWQELTADEIWGQSLEMLYSVHDAMTYNWNAYVWWYLKRYYSFIGDGIEGSTEGKILKRGYAFSHYSKYVRPGYVRIKADVDASKGLKMTAYKGDGKTVLVIINSSNSLYSLKLDNVGSAQTANAFETSLKKNRESNDVLIHDGQLDTNIGAKSILTVIIND